jgi:hypothetical protein
MDHIALIYQPKIDVDCRTSENTPRGVPVLAMTVFLSVIGIDFVGSRHLVFNWGLLGNPGWLVLSEILG